MTRWVAPIACYRGAEGTRGARAGTDTTMRNDVNTPAILMVGLLSALLFFAAIVLLEVMFYHIATRQRYEKDIDQPFAELTALVQRQQARLAEYRWVDEKKQIAAIPIDRAMELVVAELSKKGERREEKGEKKEGAR